MQTGIVETSELTNPLYALALVSMIGFAIQQLIELIDPIVTRLITGGIEPITDQEVLKKKRVMQWLSLFLSFLVVQWSYYMGEPIRTIGFLGLENYDRVDLLVTVLLLSAGTEGSNIVVKYFNYVKDGRKLKKNTP